VYGYNGVPNVNGTDHSQNYQDGRAARVAGATASATWVAADWIIDSDAPAGNGALDAPTGFDPKASVEYSFCSFFGKGSWPSWPRLAHDSILPMSSDQIIQPIITVRPVCDHRYHPLSSELVLDLRSEREQPTSLERERRRQFVLLFTSQITVESGPE
jgi:hypothetical protein